MSELICADVKQWAEDYDGPPFHALLTDAPYEMSFMGKGWDGSGIAFDSDMWAALARHLHPGAFLFVMAGTINDDLISVALRNAGLRKFHRMLGWVNGAGFPKATRIDDDVFSGHRYGGQALKPAIETVLIFQKPYAGKPVDSITATGAGALWIDGGRIPHSEPIKTMKAQPTGNLVYGQSGRYEDTTELKEGGRWPANFYLTHSPDCNGECVDGCPVKAIGEQSGESRSSDKPSYHAAYQSVAKGFEYAHVTGGHDDSGTAARFFLNADWNAEVWERLETSDPVCYTAKAGRGERDDGLNEFDIAISHSAHGDFVGTEEHPTNTNGKHKNHHPTVKPVSLTRWLATLLLPPAAYAPRRLLVPFAGVASEMIGAHLAGWEEITGIELDPEHVDIGRARLDWWGRQMSFNLGD